MDWNSVGEGAFSGVASGITNSLFGQINASINAKREMDIWNQQYDKQRADALADRAHNEEYQRQLIADQRQYDSASSQVARLKEAGLNPALAYGGGSTSPTPAPVQSAGVPSPSGIHSSFAPNMAPVDSLGFAKLRSDREVADKNLDLNKEAIVSQNNLRFAQSQLALKELGLITEQTFNLRVQNQFLESTFALRYQELENTVAMSSQQVKNLGLQNSILAAEIDRLPLVSRKLQAEVSNILYDTSLKEGQRLKLAQDTIESEKRSLLLDIEKEYKASMKEIDIAFSKSQLSEQQYRESKKKLRLGMDVAKDCVGMLGRVVDSGVKIYGAIATHGASAMLEHKSGEETIYIGKGGEIIGGTKKSYKYEPQKRK